MICIDTGKGSNRMSQQPPNYPQQPQEPYQGQPQYQQPQQGFQVQPQQPYYPQQPPKKSRKPLLFGCLGAIVLVIVVIIIAAVANAPRSSANSGAAVNTATATTGNTQPATQSDFKVGQVVSVANTWQVTVLSAKTSAGGQYNTLQHAGDLYLVVTISVKNISSQNQEMSSALLWNLQDPTGQKYDITIDPDAGATLDGTVSVGRLLKGVIAYEIPKSIKNFTLTFQSDITSTDQSIWDITV